MATTDAVRRTGMLLDLDGTLIDSVYQHVLAWRDALEAEGIDIPVWTIHRKVGMSGGLFARALLRETSATTSSWRSNPRWVRRSTRRGRAVV